MKVIAVVWDVTDVVDAPEAQVLLSAPPGASSANVVAAALAGWHYGGRWNGLLPEGYRWVLPEEDREEVE